MKKIDIAIMGLGVVGGGTYRVFTENREMIKKSRGLDVNVKKILDKDSERVVKGGAPAKLTCTNIDELVSDPDISIVVETMGGVEPAKTFITKLLSAGKSVVTANKELIAKHWQELDAAAKKGGAGLYIEASCGGGIPVIRTITEGLQANNIREIIGIINGTTNYILTEMSEKKAEYNNVLSEAQALGYAEFDPTADVEGHDAVYKLSILTSLAFGEPISYTGIYREGITSVGAYDISMGKSLGYTLKLLAIGKKSEKGVEVRVHPTFVPDAHPLASVRGVFNAVFINGDFVDDIMLYGRGAGSHPTASAISSDVIFAAEGGKGVEYPSASAQKTELLSDFTSKYYISVTAMDAPGVLASVAGIMGEKGISLEKVIQTEGKDGNAPVIFLTHECGERAVMSAADQLRKLKNVKSVDAIIRVL